MWNLLANIHRVFKKVINVLTEWVHSSDIQNLWQDDANIQILLTKHLANSKPPHQDQAAAAVHIAQSRAGVKVSQNERLPGFQCLTQTKS